MRFQLKSIDTKSSARTGEITINNSIIKTPVFMPVGTLGNVKGIMQNLLEEDSNEFFRELLVILSLSCGPGGANRLRASLYHQT